MARKETPVPSRREIRARKRECQKVWSEKTRLRRQTKDGAFNLIVKGVLPEVGRVLEGFDKCLLEQASAFLTAYRAVYRYEQCRILHEENLADAQTAIRWLCDEQGLCLPFSAACEYIEQEEQFVKEWGLRPVAPEVAEAVQRGRFPLCGEKPPKWFDLLKAICRGMEE